ncbi:hypothetical protein [Methylovulum psychrotolerans]|uniref:Phage coat protein n=1 Tax=Methylovulum psychrotolerans TaxID=1704499 RepID=A0A2S5CRD6_9GAMM|nr:hypothetical protein [Methylovulum psychrotolerans]POZ53302.1 hypothetical protein AADEFJLK_00321 [Methylovulum psychrotolerans]
MPKQRFTAKQAKIALAVVAIAASTPSMAVDATLDFSGITGAVSAGTIVTALTAVAAIKILPGFARWGYNKVIGWFR